MTVQVRDNPILPRQPGWREGSRAAPAFPCPLPAPRRAASGTGEPTAPKTPSTIESKVRNKTVLLEQSWSESQGSDKPQKGTSPSRDTRRDGLSHTSSLQSPAGDQREQSPGHYGAPLGSTSAQVCPTPSKRPGKGGCRPLSQGDKMLSVRDEIMRGETFPLPPITRHDLAAPRTAPAWHNRPACSLADRKPALGITSCPRPCPGSPAHEG